MDSHLPAERIFIVIGTVVAVIVTVLGLLAGVDAAIGIALCWAAYVALVAMARFVDRIGGFK